MLLLLHAGNPRQSLTCNAILRLYSRSGHFRRRGSSRGARRHDAQIAPSCDGTLRPCHDGRHNRRLIHGCPEDHIRPCLSAATGHAGADGAQPAAVAGKNLSWELISFLGTSDGKWFCFTTGGRTACAAPLGRGVQGDRWVWQPSSAIIWRICKKLGQCQPAI